MSGRLVRPYRWASFALAIVLFGCFTDQSIYAQTVTIVQDGKPVQMSIEQARAMRHGGAQPPVPQGAQPSPQPGQDGKPEDKDKKKDGEDGKKKEGDSTVKRPEKPPRTPDPREFKVKLDDKGRVPPFNFIGQPWPDVMQWLASLGKCTLDWQELPNDYLNLTTDKPYPLDEVRDRINRALQARGFTSIQSNEVLSVFKIEKVDPSLVRRVEEEKLYDLKPYDFVKVSFELPPSMEVDKAKDDVKQVLSPTAKVFPLVTSKRILIMDTVANLRTVSELFNTERLVQEGKIVPKEFFLKYARPQQVIEILYMMVGVDPKAKPAQTDPNVQQQQMQMMQQMQQQGRGADAAKMMQKGDAPKVYLAYNRQRNSVLVNAPPEQLKIIEQTIHCLDVPYGDPIQMADAKGPGGSERTMQRYALQSLDPDKFVSTLEEIGGLSPSTVFKVDENSKALFALATSADHQKISKLLHDFDGSGRKFKVIALHRKPADLVAATIYKLMAGQNEKKEEKRRPYWYYDFDNRDDNKKKDTIQGFGVDADIENNQLLLWANDLELERVHELLVELGEIPDGQKDSRPVRTLEAIDSKVAPQLLKRLQEAWSASEGNQLIINNPPPVPKSNSDAAPQGKDKEKTEKEKAKVPGKTADRSAAGNVSGRVAAKWVALDSSLAQASDKPERKTRTSDSDANVVDFHQPDATGSPAKSAVLAPQPVQHADAKPPITITVTPDGRWMISSTDTAALDRMEQLIEQLTPRQRRFKAFQIKHISAMDMYLDLKNYFKEDMEKESGNMTLDWFGRPIETGKGDKGATGLAKRRKLMLDWDPPSNSIIVANASASQLAEVEEMIKEFDKPPRSDSVEKRTTRPIKIKYSKPTVIAAAIKDVYRDLLSTRDKEFERGDQKDKKSGAERMTVINYGGGSGGDDEGDRGSAVKVGFEGALSLGADDVSGVLVVSCQQAIFDDIERMVHELDDQAAPQTTVQVFRVGGAVSAEALQKALSNTVGKAWLGNRPEQQPNQTGTDAEKKAAEKQHSNSNRNRSQESGK